MKKAFYPGRQRKGLTVPQENGNRMISLESKPLMYTVHELCTLTGTTRKTLFHYDKIGILKPAQRIGPQKAKLYDEEQALRLKRILNLQEAGLSLKEISVMLDSTAEVQTAVLAEAYARMKEELCALKKQMDSIEAMRRELSDGSLI